MGHPELARDFPEAARLGETLRRRGLHGAVAESCTGGLLGAALTAVPGSSDYVAGGVVAYSNAVKVGLLGVSEADLATHGAVSGVVASAMASGVRRACDAEVGIGITGIAGPGGGGDKAVGLIWIAVSGPGSAEASLRLEGDHGREPNRARAVTEALRLALEALEG